MNKWLEPLWQPRGSIRAWVVLAIVGGFVYGFVSGKVEAAVFAPVAIAVIQMYFHTAPPRPAEPPLVAPPDEPSATAAVPAPPVARSVADDRAEYARRQRGGGEG